MKKMGLGLSLALAALGFLMSPVQAAASSAADEAFLASLVATPAPTLAAKPPSAGQKALCSAGASCGSYSITCTGDNSYTSCSAVDQNCAAGQRGRVTCDGVITWCSPCPLSCYDR